MNDCKKCGISDYISSLTLVKSVSLNTMCCALSYLWNDGDSRPQLMEANLCNVDAINVDLPLGCFQYAENALSQGGFSCSSSSNYSHLRKEE